MGPPLPSSSSSSSCRLLLLPDNGFFTTAEAMSLSSSRSQPAPGEDSVGENGVGRIMSLPHPRTGQPCQYLLLPGPLHHLCEIQTVRPSGTKYGSWFVEQRVISEGKLYIMSRVDPKFLLLPILEKQTRFSPLDQILAGEEVGPARELRQCTSLQLERICDVNDKLGDDMLLYRLNEDKTIEWLSQKVMRCLKRLQQVEEENRARWSADTEYAAGFVPQGATASKEAATTGDKGPLVGDDLVALSDAADLVCEYLSTKWSDKLRAKLGVMEVHVAGTKKEVASTSMAGGKRPAVWEQCLEQDRALEFTQGKRMKAGGATSSSSSGSTAGSSTTTTTAATTTTTASSAAQKKLLKANIKGMKSISSFFGGGAASKK